MRCIICRRQMPDDGAGDRHCSRCDKMVGDVAGAVEAFLEGLT
jgi:hypothetical protein